MRAAARVVLAVAFALALPRLAHACAVCGALLDERLRKAIFNSTVYMSLLPLAVIGLGLCWLARRAGGALRAEFRESPDAVVEDGGAEAGKG